MIEIMRYNTVAAAVTRQHTNQLNEILYNILLTKAELWLLFCEGLTPASSKRKCADRCSCLSIWRADGSALKPMLFFFFLYLFTDVTHMNAFTGSTTCSENSDIFQEHSSNPGIQHYSVSYHR